MRWSFFALAFGPLLALAQHESKGTPTQEVAGVLRALGYKVEPWEPDNDRFLDIAYNGQTARLYLCGAGGGRGRETVVISCDFCLNKYLPKEELRDWRDRVDKRLKVDSRLDGFVSLSTEATGDIVDWDGTIRTFLESERSLRNRLISWFGSVTAYHDRCGIDEQTHVSELDTWDPAFLISQWGWRTRELNTGYGPGNWGWSMNIGGQILWLKASVPLTQLDEPFHHLYLVATTRAKRASIPTLSWASVDAAKDGTLVIQQEFDIADGTILRDLRMRIVNFAHSVQQLHL